MMKVTVLEGEADLPRRVADALVVPESPTVGAERNLALAAGGLGLSLKVQGFVRGQDSRQVGARLGGRDDSGLKTTSGG